MRNQTLLEIAPEGNGELARHCNDPDGITVVLIKASIDPFCGREMQATIKSFETAAASLNAKKSAATKIK